jgi:hypothetical protein
MGSAVSISLLKPLARGDRAFVDSRDLFRPCRDYPGRGAAIPTINRGAIIGRPNGLRTRGSGHELVRPLPLRSPLQGEGPGPRGRLAFCFLNPKSKLLLNPGPMPGIENPKSPCSAEAVCLKALAKNPMDRYQTMGEFERALAEAFE